MNFEKISAVVGVLVVVISAAVAWANMDNKIERMSERIKKVEDVNGAAPCLQILSRQMATIEKGMKEPERKLGELSRQYRCVPGEAIQVGVTIEDLQKSWGSRPASYRASAALERDLRAIDAQIVSLSRKSAQERPDAPLVLPETSEDQ